MDSFNILHCQVCNLKFTQHNKPLVIACGNTLCHDCLKENINRSILFECMFCKKKHFHEIKNVPVNEILLELINKSEDSKNSNTVIKYFRQF